MKRLTSLALSLVMLLTLVVPALGAEVNPTPPDWVKAEEYLILPNDSAYQQETWDKLLLLRADAAAGNKEPQKGEPLYDAWNMGEATNSTVGLCFELGLIGMKYAENAANHRQAVRARRYFSLAQDTLTRSGGSRESAEYRLITLWYLRARLLECYSGTNQVFSGLKLETFLKESGYTMEQFRSYPALSVVTEEEWAKIDANTVKEKAAAEVAKTKASVTLDGLRVDTENLAVVKDGRTMIPVRCLAELLGADVSYDSASKSARISRAGVEIVMPIGKTTATVNGKPVEMDVAPYITNGRTMIPARYVSEFFGQNIQWVSETRTAAVTENKSLAGDSNLEAWALPMGAYPNWARTARADIFGGRARGTALDPEVIRQSVRPGKTTAYPYEEARFLLNGDSWDIQSREDLIETVCAMTANGHNGDFLHDVAMIKSLSPAEYQQILDNATGMDKYMFPYTKKLGEKWGDKGIIAWDLARMSNLVQWGYTAGYLTYPEALALLRPAAEAARKNFSSWKEFFENYLDGYNWWAREDVQGKGTWAATRGPTLERLLAKNDKNIFDDTLFQTPVKGVPNLTAEQLLQSVSQ